MISLMFINIHLLVPFNRNIFQEQLGHVKKVIYCSSKFGGNSGLIVGHCSINESLWPKGRWYKIRTALCFIYSLYFSFFFKGKSIKWNRGTKKVGIRNDRWKGARHPLRQIILPRWFLKCWLIQEISFEIQFGFLSDREQVKKYIFFCYFVYGIHSGNIIVL